MRMGTWQYVNGTPDNHVFVSYAHADSRLVLREIETLKTNGIDVYYDDGITPGSEWSEQLAGAIKNSHHFIYFITPNSVASENCRRELNFAIAENIPVLAVHLEETEVPDGIRLNLDNRQALKKYELTEIEFQSRLFESLGESATRPVSVKTSQKRHLNRLTYLSLFLITAALTVTWFQRSSIPADNVEPVLALIPLRNLSDDTDEYLGEAVVEEISTRLSLSGLKMIAARSSRIFRNSDADARDIAAQLGATHLVDGSVTGAGRISLNLIDGASGTTIWRNAYSEDVTSSAQAFALYDGAAHAIVDQLGAGRSRTPTMSVYEPDIAAYTLVQRAVHGSQPVPESISLLDRAIEIDPQYAEAYAEKARLISFLAEVSIVRPIEGFEQARSLALKALELNPVLARAYGTLGAVYDRVDLDFRKAIDAYTEATRLGALPKHLDFKQDTYLQAGLYEEGLAFTSEWERTDPLNGHASLYSGRFLNRMGDRESAAKKYEKALTLTPEDRLIHVQVFQFRLFRENNPERAREVLQFFPPRLKAWGQALIALHQGDVAPLRRVGAELAEGNSTSRVSSSFLRRLFFLTGDYEEHFRWFAISVQDRDGLGWMLDFTNYQHPDYWERLNAWALANPGLTRERLALITEHRSLFDQVTEKMVL